MKIDVSAADVVEVDTDGRGRVTLGSEYADMAVEIAILDVEDGVETADSE